MSEDVVDKCEIRLPRRFRIHDSAGQVFRRHFGWPLALLFARSAFIFARLAELHVHGAQDAVDKSPRAIASEGFCELYRFVDSDLGGHLRTIGIEKFRETEPQDVPVDSGDLVERPLPRRARADLVDLFLFCHRALEELFHKRHVAFTCPKFFGVFHEPLLAILLYHGAARGIARSGSWNTPKNLG